MPADSNLEFIAIKKIEKVLVPFSRRQKARILQFVIDRMGMSANGPDPEDPAQVKAATPPKPDDGTKVELPPS